MSQLATLEIIHGNELEYKALGFKHRVGEPEFKYLFRGQDGTLENYMLALGRQKKFYSPVHKHNFDQFRFAYQGDFSIAENVVIKEGELCYHPEGVEYGPQRDEEDGTDHILLILQFGGTSGQGYLSYDQLLSVQADLKNHGKFEGGKFHPTSGGEPKDGFEATWEHFNKRKLVYPQPRYTKPILMKPENFAWKNVANGGGVGAAYKKHLGTFTERAVLAQMLKVERGGQLKIEAVDGFQLVFVFEGEGEVDGKKLVKESAFRLMGGQEATLSSDSSLKALHLVVPAL
ncbi:hypothetical protein N431DRAFT_519400 [Stipitochalara longipes BDJ]|nr:hypothetical protein N431DRAFT_519400 [Stipitochalara longipes BDJ]